MKSLSPLNWKKSLRNQGTRGFPGFQILKELKGFPKKSSAKSKLPFTKTYDNVMELSLHLEKMLGPA